jgi:hypothetical protein
MNPVEDLKHQSPEEILQSIDRTRASLNHKIEALGEEVLDSVETARATVSERVENIKEAFTIRGVLKNGHSLSSLLLIGFGIYIGRYLRKRIKRALIS